MCWAIWSARNKFYFDKVQRHLKLILDEALGFLEEYQQLNAKHSFSFFSLLLWASFCTAVPGFLVASAFITLFVCFVFLFFFGLCWHAAILLFDYSFTSIKFYILSQKKKKKKKINHFNFIK